MDGSPSLTAVLWPCVPSRHRRGMVVRQWRRMLPGGFVWASHGSMVWHGCCLHIQVKEGGGWITIADSRIVAVCPFPASPWYGSPSMAADGSWGFVCVPSMARWCGIDAASTFR